MSRRFSPVVDLLMAVYIPTLILAFGRGMLTPILPLYSGSFNVSYGLIGIALASQGIGNLLGDLPAGILSGRIGQKRTMLVGLGSMALSMFAVSWARTFTELVLYFLLSGVGMALWNISRHAYITESTPIARRGRAIAIFGGVNRIGTFAGPAVGGVLGSIYGLRAPFLVYAVLTAVAILFPLLVATEPEPSPARLHAGPNHSQGHLRELWEVTKNNLHTLTPAGLGQLLAQMIRAGRNAVIPLYGADVLGLDADSIGYILSISGGIDMVMFPIAGFVMDRLGRKYAYVPCFLGQGIGMALIPFTGGFTSLLVASSLIGISNGLGSGTMMTLGADLAPDDARGQFLGIWRLIGDVGQTGGPIAVGGIADLLGLSMATFVIAGAGFLSAAVFGLLVPETLHATPGRTLNLAQQDGGTTKRSVP